MSNGSSKMSIKSHFLSTFRIIWDCFYENAYKRVKISKNWKNHTFFSTQFFIILRFWPTFCWKVSITLYITFEVLYSTDLKMPWLGPQTAFNIKIYNLQTLNPEPKSARSCKNFSQLFSEVPHMKFVLILLLTHPSIQPKSDYNQPVKC